MYRRSDGYVAKRLGGQRPAADLSAEQEVIRTRGHSKNCESPKHQRTNPNFWLLPTR
jgi:hypothetical protein